MSDEASLRNVTRLKCRVLKVSHAVDALVEARDHLAHCSSALRDLERSEESRRRARFLGRHIRKG